MAERIDTYDLLDTREQTHGDFRETAETAQRIKAAIADVREGRLSLDPVMQEAVDLIATKLGRIASGNAFEVDHWSDISGYALLVVRHLEKMEGATQTDTRAVSVRPGKTPPL